jgi:hypothetical protein
VARPGRRPHLAERNGKSTIISPLLHRLGAGAKDMLRPLRAKDIVHPKVGWRCGR